MEAAMERQIDSAGELMKEFIDTVLGLYRHIGEEDVLRQADGETLQRLLSRGIPREGRPGSTRSTGKCSATCTQKTRWCSIPAALRASPAPSPSFPGWATS